MKILRILVGVVAFCFGLQSFVNAQIFYKIEKDGNDKTSYILGTHHLAPLSVVDSIAELPEIMKKIDKLYGEVDMRQMTDPAVMMSMQKMMIAPSDSTIEKLLTPVQLDSVRMVWNEYIGNLAPFDMVKIMKPAILSAQLAAAMSMKSLPEINPLEGIDITMQNRAREAGKIVEGLESLDFQMQMIYGTPIDSQIESLMEMIRKSDVEGSRSEELNNAYLSHDIDKILELMLEAEYDDPEAAERLIYKRNDNWVKILVEEMPETSLMIVVGAGHLPGERGVLHGLRSAGYKVTPIK